MEHESRTLSQELVVSALDDRWRIEAAEIEYLPVGGGGQHWRVRAADASTWFVTANRLVGRGHFLEPDADSMYARTKAAYETARLLNLDFAVTAVPDRDGAVVFRMHAEWALSVYPFIEGKETSAGDDHLMTDVAALVGTLHSTPAPRTLPLWRSDLPQRHHLERALEESQRPWGSSPYAESTRRLLAANRSKLRSLLDRYDRLALVVADAPQTWVVTHGEPHAGNIVRATDGTPYMIDWDTVALAPRERDLWHVMDAPSGAAWESYQAATGTAPAQRPPGFDFFRLWWRLASIGENIRRIRAALPGDADDADAWEFLKSSVG